MSLTIGDEVFHGREIRMRFDTVGRPIEFRDGASYPGGRGVTRFHSIGALFDASGSIARAGESISDFSRQGFRTVQSSDVPPSRFGDIVAAVSELRRRCGQS